MNKKILLWTDRDGTKPFDYTLPTDVALEALGGNSGNAAFEYAMQRMLTVPGNQVDIVPGLMRHLPDLDRINEEYDCMVITPANLLALWARDFLVQLATDLLAKIKIPIYAIGLGANSDVQYTMDFIPRIYKQARAFVDVILNSGGGKGCIGVRGYFTADCMKALGYQEGTDFFVIGCPSFFINGPSFKVEKQDITQEQLVPLVNGFRFWDRRGYRDAMMAKYPHAKFVCQEEFYNILYRPNCLGAKEKKYLSFPSDVALFVNDRVALYGDIPAWHTDIREGGYNFSFGCRVHGNVVPLTAGVPAYVDVFDSRTRELAEYFEIPHETFGEDYPDLYELYQQTDYTAFNRGYPEKYARFCEFMERCGLNFCRTKIQIPSMDPPHVAEQTKAMLLAEAEKLQKDRDVLEAHRKIAFVAHEFGIFKGNGGIAMCLHQLVRAILDHCPHMEVYVISVDYNKQELLNGDKRFHAYHLMPDSPGAMGREVLEILKEIRPDYVELAEYLGLGLESLVYRVFHGRELAHTVFFTDHHTATRECYEWSTLMPFKLAQPHLRVNKEREHAQMILSDMNMAPSHFLADYDTQNYAVDVVYMPHVVYLDCETKAVLQNRVGTSVDLVPYENKFVVSCISRYEQRKNQVGLVRAFCDFLERTGADACLILAGNTSYNEITGEDYRRAVYRAIPPQYRDSVLMFDFMDKQGKDKIIAITDVAVMASPYENFPVAMTEYVMQDVPIIASRYSGCFDYVGNSRRTFDPFVDGDLSQKIEDFYNQNVGGWRAAAQHQRETLQELCGINSAVKEKLAAYNRYARKLPQPSTLERVFVTENDLHAKVSGEGICNVVLTISKTKDIAIWYADKLSSVFALSEKNMICLGPEERYDPVVHLVNDGIVLLPKVNLTPASGKLLWKEFLANVILKREKYAAFIPMSHQDTVLFGVETWKALYDQIFYKRYALDLEGRYHHDS